MLRAVARNGSLEPPRRLPVTRNAARRARPGFQMRSNGRAFKAPFLDLLTFHTPSSGGLHDPPWACQVNSKPCVRLGESQVREGEARALLVVDGGCSKKKPESKQ